ncbi:2-oxoglutarate dehydrogenase E1 component [Cellulophaga baltica]|uniref:oxoglutarate dehydrogenase (succinyl-transferring) n=2 Tax=Cellulophaga baltica TaxID=76594 RepID=A0A1G7D0G8_9FLAO|nr:2-oxoglutarate dehydrogenase E1 component [Cellulophaga baltica]AIY13052.1 2-oxoglutarate dehydrogenase [Cellulophaga baltica NN016038]AIZ41419.1 2-oxoglutarate dehydrogenase [Cellulophaga baltica 18]WFO14610.1 2-oxoglutarate dehydrogenase E1 component [Cellulophaga baltica 4]SDE45058.1 2-oxoglutarate dehydrogenase E1 component [Cellulophaga baltica]
MDKYSFLNAAHTSFFAELYDKYLINPDSVEPSWRAFFQGFDFGQESLLDELDLPVTPNNVAAPSGTSEMPQSLQKEFQVIRLIDGYRSRGHLFTKTNPVRERRKYEPTLAIENFGLSSGDLNTVFTAGEILGIGPSTLTEIISHLTNIYCDAIGVEYMYIRNPERIEWIQNWLNVNDNHPNYDNERKKNILRKLNQAISFESFLHTKYVGQKRFSLEGNESLIPALDAIVERAAEMGVEQFVMGMAHRGRLNVLTNIFGKAAKDIFSEFDGKDYEQVIFDGDVKYHLGWTSDRMSDNGNKIKMNIAPNPSHLETVGAVVEGITRAKQDAHYKDDFSKVLPIVVHGDAAIAGQGLVYEVIQMASLDGYKTGGTIHMVVNNQIGFTTNYLDARSSTYCTDVGKVTLSPVLHVNADDAEAVVHASLFALEYRMRFQRDVFLDLLGYRKYGHNEGDEPRFTQPKLYKAIAKHENPRDIYAAKLIAEGIIDENYISKLEQEYKDSLETELEDSRKEDKTVITPFMADEWKGFVSVQEDEMVKPIDTSYPKEKLTQIANSLTSLPKGKKFLRKVDKLVEDRRKMFFENDSLDWAMGELLAYGSLLQEGFGVRMSGQDVERGTFSHRHAVVKVEDSEEEVVPLNLVEGKKGDFHIFNSHLSEYGVVGFDYGYAMASPNTLTIWEAQFGDFSNGAQIMIDQYISAAEDKWKLQNGLVMLLPHGYEGQGAEHSSARMERFLQLCASDNMFIADVTTPANMFHLLRRQMKANFRKPLVVFTPKSLLRHPKAVSSIEEFATGGFQEVIDDAAADVKKVKTLVFCTGKFYYDLLAAREEHTREDVALVRVEQLFPLPAQKMKAIMKKYAEADDVVWAQEEPRNMGAWSHIMMHFSEASTLRVASRRFYASPAAGSAVRSKRRHQEVIDYVFDKSKDNMIRK